MKALKIIGCSDSLMWYRDKIGEIVPFINEDETYYWSREPAGYKNIVKKRDGVIIDTSFNLDQYQIDFLFETVKKTNCTDVVRTTYDYDLECAIKERIIEALKGVL